MDAVQAGNIEGISKGELQEEIGKVETEIRRRLPIGWSTSYASLIKEFVQQQGYSSHALERTLYILEKREVIRYVPVQILLRFTTESTASSPNMLTIDPLSLFGIGHQFRFTGQKRTVQRVGA